MPSLANFVIELYVYRLHLADNGDGGRWGLGERKERGIELYDSSPRQLNMESKLVVQHL